MSPGGVDPVVDLLDIASDHHADDAGMVEFGGGAAADETPVAQNGDAVGDLEHLLQPMRHEDDGEAARAQSPHGLEQSAHLARRKRRGRLVHHQHPRLLGDGAGDLDQLPLGRRKLARELQRIEVRRDLFQRGRSAAHHLRAGRGSRSGVGQRPSIKFSATVMPGTR